MSDRPVRGHATPLSYHRGLLDDVTRVHAYDLAIRRQIRPGDVVLDLGAGTGLLSMLAARQGARVHAVESMPVAGVARDLIAANGLSDRVVVHEADVVQMAPVEPVDWVIGEFMGRYLVDDGMLDAVAASRRWLKPGGRFLPERVVLKLGLAGDFALPELDRFLRPLLGLDLSAAAPHALSTCYHAALGPEHLLGEAAELYTLDPRAPEAQVKGEVRLEVARDGLLRGLLGWFDASLGAGVELSTRPGTDTHWGQYLFPLPAVLVQTGDVLEVALWEEQRVRWRWEVAHLRGGEVISTRSASSEQRLGSLGAEPAERRLDRAAVIAGNAEAAAALTAGRIHEALVGFERLVAGVADADLVPVLYENLGLARFNGNDLLGAIECFLRALDGAPTSREQSLRFAVTAGLRLGRRDAAGWLAAYEEAFGAHPARGG